MLTANAPSTTVATARGGARPEPGTLTGMFFSAVREYDRDDALQRQVGDGWEPISHREVERRVRRLALALLDAGVRPGDRVAILSENRPEWAIADYACLTIGATDVPIYPTLPAEQLPYLFVDSGAVVAFVSTEVQARKLASVRDRCPALRQIVGIAATAAHGCDVTLDELEARGEALDTPERAAEYRRYADAVKPDDVATIIYTSGTTGEPKGVMLTTRT
jgi:long-chain acyl-CoA synthetase